jgi:hypothetical protein
MTPEAADAGLAPKTLFLTNKDETSLRFIILETRCVPKAKLLLA